MEENEVQQDIKSPSAEDCVFNASHQDRASSWAQTLPALLPAATLFHSDRGPLPDSFSVPRHRSTSLTNSPETQRSQAPAPVTSTDP